MMYQLLLKNMLKYTERAKLLDEAKELSRAVRVMNTIPKRANDMMKLGRLQGFDRRLSAQGHLLQQGQLSISFTTNAPRSASLAEIKAMSMKAKQRQVFLFEKILLVSKIISAKSEFSLPWFNFKSEFPVNWMSLHDDLSDPCKFCIVCTNPQQVVCQCVI